MGSAANELTSCAHPLLRARLCFYLAVWEHAYYLDWQSKRAEYVRCWWKVVNWERVEQRLAAHNGKSGTASDKTHQEL